MWRTAYVCHPLSGALNSNTCMARDLQSNHIFNLMPLSDYNHKIPFKDDTQFIINVCKPTLYGHDEMCPPNSAVCFDNGSKNVTERFKNYGTAIADPIFENDKLFMKFTSDEKCNGTNKTITSLINFICDETIQVGRFLPLNFSSIPFCNLQMIRLRFS